MCKGRDSNTETLTYQPTCIPAGLHATITELHSLFIYIDPIEDLHPFLPQSDAN
ncbi:hypothetical protein HanXRQr2_Chr09g0368411 [Helianthus annuus]|uniref:Uncharacterized protein n=1 Tax=Helianthus annuus TaxID=4232 RepID=A0A251TSV2_HELAN|nr:hypothetical protein HanXRQr2_Chr09g0368411 [Helianthus annuus]KAJ0891511.1 hypothetical protein HanPSC8_Chr09g0354821 [Helianthus annuus]